MYRQIWIKLACFLHFSDVFMQWMSVLDARDLILLKSCFNTLKIHNQSQKLTPGNIGYKRVRDGFAARRSSRLALESSTTAK